MQSGLNHPVGASKVAEAPEKVIGEILAGIRTLHRWSRQKSGVSKAAEPPKKREKAAEGGFDKTGDDRNMQNHHRLSLLVR